MCLGLAWFYVAAATEHARVVNTSKARGDQSGYLWDAEQVYANWHGRRPPALIGVRMRMPLYAAFLATVWDPQKSDDEFFDVAKTWNIRLSLVLLAGLAIAFSRELPTLLATNLTLIVGFGYFVFKAGYAQPELLFYSVFFAAFLASCHLFFVERPVASVLLGALVGVLSGLAHLTKAVMPPFLVIVIGVFVGEAAIALVVARRRRDPSAALTARRRFASRSMSAVTLAVSFLLVVYPYIANSKRVFGEYFFNANTSYYMWYDSGALARAWLIPRTDEAGKVTAPPELLPTFSTYWRSHSVVQILGRFAEGFEDMAVRSYRTYWYLKYVAIYILLAIALIASDWTAFARAVRTNVALCIFLLMYAAVYSLSTAFFAPISSTGTTRFLLAHVAPLLFVLSRFFARAPFRDARWALGRFALTASHVHALVLVSLVQDLAFTVWWRLLSTYGGF